MDIVLYEPEMPANTGNIGRTCVATGTRLHLIQPLGFKINEKSLKRAGLDYWDKLDVTLYADFKDFLERNPGAKLYMATTKAKKVYTEVCYAPDCYLMFGPESRGIPEELQEAYFYIFCFSFPDSFFYLHIPFFPVFYNVYSIPL